MALINGTTGNDTLIDTSGNDIIEGLAGDDFLSSTLDGEDILRGGDGSDTLFARRSYYNSPSNLPAPGLELDGGSGDDLITVEIYGQRKVTAIGGLGADRIVLAGGGYNATVNAGEGNDILEIGPINSIESSNVTVTMGSGSDTIIYNASYGNVIVTDFSAMSGDKLVFGDVLAGLLPTWDQATNPFSIGFITITQVGSDTAIGLSPRADAGDRTARTFITLQNVNAGSLTATSLGGYSPDGSAPVAITTVGTAANDRFEASPGNDRIDGGGGNDLINGGAGADVLRGGDGADTIDGGLGADSLYGDAGDDVLIDHYGPNNQLFGGDGNDTITLSYVGGYYPGNGALPFGGNIDGGTGNDTIVALGGVTYPSNGGSPIKSTINVLAGEGDDRVSYRDAVGQIDLGAGNDRLTLTYGSGSSTGAVTIALGANQDVIDFEAFGSSSPGASYVITDFAAGSPGDRVDLSAILVAALTNWDGASNPFSTKHLLLLPVGGGSYNLVVDPNGSVDGANYNVFMRFDNLDLGRLVDYNFSGYSPEGTAPTALNLSGTVGGDVLTGGVGNDSLQGLAGNDILLGGFGNDILDGGDGDDQLTGGLGADLLIGGAGNDTINEATRGGDRLYGGDGDDVLSLMAESYAYNQVAIGGTLLIDGGAGNDRISYFAGLNGVGYSSALNPTLLGGSGDDTIAVGLMNGGGLIDAGSGDDKVDFSSMAPASATITLGGGVDTIVLTNTNGTKTVTDFKAGEAGDRLVISGYTGTLALTQIGTTTAVQAVSSGYSQTIISLQNVKAADLSAYNLSFISGIYAPSSATLIGSDGSDDLVGADANDQISGRAGNDFLFGGGGDDTLLGGADNDLLDGGSGSDRLDGGDGFDTASYARALTGVKVDLANVDAQDTGMGRDTLVGIEGLIGSAFADDLRGNAANNTIAGGGGRDTLFGGGGDDLLDGGANVDRASYLNLFRSYTPQTNSGATILHGTAAEGTDTLTSVEYISFKDGTLISDPDAVGSQITRLYDTVLQRTPDNLGLDFYLDRIEDQGGSLLGVANDLIGSSEFKNATGSLSNAQFVDYVYQHALGRPADAGGQAYYTGALDQGVSRGSLLVSFSESAEHRELTQGIIGDGYFNTDDTYQAVALLYDGAFNRLPDANGLSYYAERVKSGALTLSQVTYDFAGSAEFSSAISGKDNGQIVDFIYQNTLDRDPDVGGRAFYKAQLDHGATAAGVLQDVALSIEHYYLYSSHITQGIDII